MFVYQKKIFMPLSEACPEEVFFGALRASQTKWLVDNCRKALNTLPLLKGCQVHTTTMLGEVDLKIFKKLGVDVTSDPQPKKG